MASGEIAAPIDSAPDELQNPPPLFVSRRFDSEITLDLRSQLARGRPLVNREQGVHE